MKAGDVMDKGYLSLKEAAEYLGMTPVTLRGYIRRGMIPAYQFDRVVRIHKDELESALRQMPYRGNHPNGRNAPLAGSTT